MNSDHTYVFPPVSVSITPEPEKVGPYFHLIDYGWKGFGLGFTIATDEPQNEYEKRETYISIVFMFWGLTIGVRT